MASAEPAANQQPQQQDPSKQQNPIDQLQAMLNLVLVQSGRFIKEHQSGGGTGRMKLSLQRAVPAAAERFHDSLDELENEIYLAQAVLRRDLALLKADRKKREAAAKQQEAERARLAAETSAKKNAPLKKEDTPVQKEPTPAEPETASANNNPSQSDDQPSLKREEGNTKAPTSEAPAADPLFDGTPPAANPQDTEFDFDAMFGEAMDSMGDNQGDINMDGGDLNFDLDDNSLIPGLDDFGKTNDGTTGGGQSTSGDLDFPMGDLPDLNTNTNTASTNPPPAEQPPASKPAETPAMTTQTAPPPDKDKEITSPLGDVMADDLNDLFNIDEYENPETSQFDDAFFDFGA